MSLGLSCFTGDMCILWSIGRLANESANLCSLLLSNYRTKIQRGEFSFSLCSICYSEGKVPVAFKQEEYRFKEYGSETEAMKDKLKLFSLYSDFSPDNP